MQVEPKFYDEACGYFEITSTPLSVEIEGGETTQTASEHDVSFKSML